MPQTLAVSTTQDLREGPVPAAFNELAMRDGFTYVRRTSFPVPELTLAQLVVLGDVEVAAREGSGCAVVLRLKPDMLVAFVSERGQGTITVAAEDCDAVDAVIGDLVAVLREDEMKDDEVPVTFLASASGRLIEPRRRISAPKWADIRGNYSAGASSALDELMAARGPGPGGLLLWHGEPATGKSYALRALAREWRGVAPASWTFELGPQGSGRKDVHMPRTRPPYPPEFRRQAVELIRSGTPLKQVAEELGVSEQTLRNWRRQGDIDAGRLEGLTSDEREELRRLRRVEPPPAAGARDPQGGRGFLRPGDRSPVMCFRLIEAKRAQHPVSLLCSVLGVSRAGYYAWKARPVSPRERRDGELRERIREIHGESKGTYGWPRVHAELRHRGVRCSRKRVARLMREAGLSGMVRRRQGNTTIRVPGIATAPDLVRRDFAPAAANRLWVADLTEVATWEGKLYLAVVIDCYSRRCVGWAMAEHMRAELVVEALEMAIWRRRPDVGLVHHSDRGGQGGFTWSSQHLIERGCDGQASGLDEGVDGQGADEVAGQAVAAA